VKDVVLYRFDDGWEVRRVLDPSERQRLTKREFWAEDRSLFGLYDATGMPRSSVDLETSPPFLDAGLSALTPKEMVEPTDPAVEPYWTTFVSECIDEGMVPQIVQSVLGYPDALLEQLANPEIEAVVKEAIDRLQKTDRRRSLSRYLERSRELELTARKSAEEAFDGLEGIVVLPPRVQAQDRYATIHILANDHVLLISADDGGWIMRSGTGAMPSLQMENQPSLLEMWRWYVEVVGDRELTDLVPESQLDAWWAEHTMPGQCLFDLEPYALLNVDSPFVFSDEPFWAWYIAQEGS